MADRSTPPSQPQPKETPRTIISKGIDNNSIPEVRRGLNLFIHSKRGLDSFHLDWTLALAVKRAQPGMVRYLLEESDVTVEGLSPLAVGVAARDPETEVGKVLEVLEVLVERGWDINAEDRSGAVRNGQYLIYTICQSETLVRWCLSHGAHVSYPDADPNRNSPLSEIVAQRGTVDILKLLLEHGAVLGRRTLHRAVESAAYASPESRAQKMEMVRFLVDEQGVAINGMDTPEGEQRPNHWGVPIAYAVPATSGEGDEGVEVVRYLLGRGADPSIKDCWGMFDVFSLAERLENERILGVLRELEAQKAEMET